jgi:hypothetical protein
MSDARIEWRGDLFAADLAAARTGLARFPLIARPFRHTMTVFLHPAGREEIDLGAIIRLRAYGDLETVSAGAIAVLLQGGLHGKLQRKAQSGAMRSLGSAMLRWPDGELLVAGTRYRPLSVRVSERLHHSLADAASSGPETEARRATVDLDRHLFRLAADGEVRLLGQLGPRIEFKGPTQAWVDDVRIAVDADHLVRRRPNRALELLFQDMLRDKIVSAPGGFPEAELKFDLQGGVDDAMIDAAVLALGDVRPLLPPPHRIERVRRYHLCRDRLSSDACTVVETPSGRLSEKRKRNSRALGGVLLRDTIASRTTDRDGVAVSIADFLADRGWTCLAMFEKTQTKLPFALPGGRAYLISVDQCFAPDGRTLDQVELEFIGSVDGAPVDPANVVAELQELGRRLQRSALGRRLTPSTHTKHGFFSVAATLVA